MRLFEKCLEEKYVAEQTIRELRSALLKCEEYCEQRDMENKFVGEKLSSVKELLAEAEASILF